MSQAFALVYHPDIRERDLPLIDARQTKRIAEAIQNRLATAPQQYGSPLKRSLKGYWKLRVGDYRIVFRTVGREVWIYAIINRKNVYERLKGRLHWPAPR